MPPLGSSLEIDRGALIRNIQKVRHRIGNRFLWAVIKANGYGLGATSLAPVMVEGGVDGFAVARLEEALELRKLGITLPILLLGPLPDPCPEDETIHLTLSGRADLKRAIEGQYRNPFHLKFETGMGRLGFTENPRELLSHLTHLRGPLIGLWSHLSHADDPSHPQTALQRERFYAILEEFHRVGIYFSHVHLSNSAGLLSLSPWETAVRVGLFIYGVSPLNTPIPELTPEPCLEWKSALFCVRKLPAGSTISYHEEYRLPNPSWVGVVPVGYADGLVACPPEPLEIFAEGRRYPIRGRITMDLLVVELGSHPLPEGTTVYLIGPRDHPLGITVRELARHLGKIPYELLTGIGNRVHRCVL
jgi:alanine racemase